jgi:hypothetical protein
MLTHDSTELTDPGVVPSLADRWSHHTDGTHLKVVPCHWRATLDGMIWHRANETAPTCNPLAQGSSPWGHHESPVPSSAFDLSR